ncbi:MAG: hypothetical protein J6Y36_01465 [Treponema sp.]|uniref:hypothetical protein n=1 Tax=Treponema sp. TaxID=166 RepID=UPI001B4AB04B|nr:hypothetical protein [Treponema sp.]MBP5401805.1 hypothetical protein [Treponema sp.]MBR5934113.1 hypothetical protein [Treponema sp.]
MPDKEFSNQVITLIDKKIEFYNKEILVKMLENYRLLHTCVKNLIDALVQKSIIKPDPYKLEKKISDVELIPNDPFLDSERALVIGTRISDYEAILDFVSTYYKFSIENLTFQKIKKFVDFNSTFNWHGFSTSSPSANTRGLSILLNEAKHNAPAMTVSMINDTISKCDKVTKEINFALKDLGDFQKEVYKTYIRKDIFEHPKFDEKKAGQSVEAEVAEIKKMFPVVMGKTPFYTALIEEIANEDLGPDKAKRQAAVLEKIKISESEIKKKEKTVDTKEILMQAILALSALAPQFSTVMTKIIENHNTLQNGNQTFFGKLACALRKAFNIPEPPVIYNITITESSTGAKTRDKLEFQQFTELLEKKMNFFNSFSLRQAPGFQKIQASNPEKILEFLNKNISEAQKIIIKLTALDDFFKSSVPNDKKILIKGLKMELTTLKNTLINVNQHKADYLSYIEEQAQMKKLGITNET